MKINVTLERGPCKVELLTTSWCSKMIDQQLLSPQQCQGFKMRFPRLYKMVSFSICYNLTVLYLDIDLGPGQYTTNQNFDLSLDEKNHPDLLYPGQHRDQGFSHLPRWRAADAPRKNFRIGSVQPQPCVGTYNPDVSSFTKTK